MLGSVQSIRRGHFFNMTSMDFKDIWAGSLTSKEDLPQDELTGSPRASRLPAETILPIRAARKPGSGSFFSNPVLRLRAAASIRHFRQPILAP